MRIVDGNIFEGMRLVLPEHRAMMVDLERRQREYVPRPSLDDDEMAEMQQVLATALADHRQVTVSVYDEMRRYPVSVAMVPMRFDEATRSIRGRGVDGRAVSVDLADVIAVAMVDE